MVEENKELHRRVRGLEEISARVEADELIAFALSNSAGVRIVTQILDNRDAESLKQLAQALISHPNTIALLGSREHDAARLVFARSTDTIGDMNALMHDACAMIDGRGGGKPDMAQGGGKNIQKLRDAIDEAAKTLT
jgi:alanyl-tRNA synthetase